MAIRRRHRQRELFAAGKWQEDAARQGRPDAEQHIGFRVVLAKAELVRARLARHRRLLEEAVEKPPDAYRTIFMLRDVEEMSTADTADVLEITEENFKVRLHRSRGLLRKSLYARAGTARQEAFNFHAVRCDRVVKNVFERIQKHVSKTGNAAAGMQ